MIRRIVFKFIVLVALIGGCCVNFLYSNPKPKKKAVVSKKAQSTKTVVQSNLQKDSKRKESKTAASKKISSKAGSVVKVLSEQNLRPGIRYSHTIMRGADKNNHSVHIVSVQRSIEGNGIIVMKGKERYNQLERLVDMVPRWDSMMVQAHSSEVLAAVNANFWRAYLNNPIGPTIINGQVVEMPSYKLWSSMLFDQFGKPYFDRFIVSGEVRYPPQRIFAIESVNNRQSLPGIVLYNTFYGTTVPMNVFPTAEEIEHELKINRTWDEDSTEAEIKRADIEKVLFERKQSASIEYGLPKVQVEFLGTPMVNREVRAVVRQLRGHSISIPAHGVVLSFGSNIPPEKIPARGDTIVLGFFTNVHRDVPMMNSISGTPLIERDCVAEHEAYIEGSKSKRFIKHGLPRTAIGFSADGSTLYLVGVDGKNNTQKTHGATLQDMAILMKSLGAYQAMNLDGGGSSAMVVRRVQEKITDRNTTQSDTALSAHRNVVRIGSGVSQRRIAVGIGVRASVQR